MTRISFDALDSVLPTAVHQPTTATFAVAPVPEPFVAPPLLTTGSASFAAEILFVEASAAVGKSTLASYMSARHQLPMLNLAVVPVSTGSVRALISALAGSGPVTAFHQGRLPLIIDALDEGRLLSGEVGFDAFIDSTADFLLENRQTRNKLKLLIFGRHESIDLATIGLTRGDITMATVEVDFFDESGARELVEESARLGARRDGAYPRHRGAARNVLTAYFAAIERALGLEEGTLWLADRGRAFAGYAPVLVALGSLLAGLDNFAPVLQQLRASGTREAWAVLEAVIYEILNRERAKLVDKLATRVSGALPPQTYDAEEQLRFLSSYVQREPLKTTGRVMLPAVGLAKYNTMVEQYIPEHPFVRNRELVDEVLGSVVLAHGVANDLFATDVQRLELAARLPFLWRSLQRHLGPGTLLDGRYVGFALSSFWTDPITGDRRVVVYSDGDDVADVSLSYTGNVVAFAATLPLHLAGQMRDASIRLRGSLVLDGQALRSSQSAFYFYGNCSVDAAAVEVAADVVTVEGELRVSSDSLLSRPTLSLFVKDGKIGWGGKFASTHPWNRFPSTLKPRRSLEGAGLLERMIAELASRLPDGTPLTVNADLSLVQDQRLDWLARKYGDEFPKVLGVLIERGLADAQEMQASGAKKLRVHFDVTWKQLDEALAEPDFASPRLISALGAARSAVED